MQKRPKVFILILHWQNYDVTRKCLSSLKKIKYPDYEVIVLDNASTNESAKRLKQEFPEFLFFFNKRDNGYGAGMNPGIEYSLNNGAEYIFLLNNDVIVTSENFIEKLVFLMDGKKEIGICGPRLLFENGKYQRSYRSVFLSLALGFYSSQKVVSFFRKVLSLPDKGNISHKVDWLNAVALFIRADVFRKIGRMDECFFLGAEDVDLSMRAKKNGWETWYCAESELVHLSFVSHENNDGVGYDKYWVESTILFLKKYYPLYLVFIVKFLMFFGLALRGIQWMLLSLFNNTYLKRAKRFFTIGYLSLVMWPKCTDKI